MKRNFTKINIRKILDELIELFKSLVDYIICIYMLSMIVILPFYNSEGFNQIGTDKAIFFCRCGVWTAEILLPIIVLYALLKLGKAVWNLKQEKNQVPSDCSYIGFFANKGIIYAICRFYRCNFLLTDVFAALYATSLILSYILSEYKETALWGTSGWYMGLVPQLMLVAIYFFVSICWRKREWMFYVLFSVSFIVFVLGCLDRFGIHILDMKLGHENPAFISTIGNVNWYCGYMVSVLFTGVGMLWLCRVPKSVDMQQRRHERRVSIMLGLYTIIGFATLVTHGSSSAIIALGAVILVMLCMSAKIDGGVQRFCLILFLLGAVCIVNSFVISFFPKQITRMDDSTEFFIETKVILLIWVVAFVLFLMTKIYSDRKKNPQKLFEIISKVVLYSTVAAFLIISGMIIFNTRYPGIFGKLSDISWLNYNIHWGSNRGSTWGIGWGCFMSQNWLHRLFGVGPDCMSAYLYNDAGIGLRNWAKEVFGNKILTNAHCEWLTVLTNVGVLGVISYVGMIISLMVNALKNKKSNIGRACGFGILAYTANGLVSFQQTMGAVTLFVIMGMAGACLRKRTD